MRPSIFEHNRKSPLVFARGKPAPETGSRKMKQDVAFRLEQAETVGLGFVLPPKIAEVVRIVREKEAKPEVENAG